LGERRFEGMTAWYIEQIFKELPFGVAIAMVVFLAILLIIWLLLPLWVLFIQWNTGKIKDEIRNLVELIEKREWEEKGKSSPVQKVEQESARTGRGGTGGVLPTGRP
jgi:hypothetical protein